MNQRSKKSIPVLTYHSLNVDRNSYEGNDHLAFESDLRSIDSLGYRVLPLEKIVAWVEGRVPWEEVEGGVALTLDDGSWLDFHDIQHPTCGPQRSMFNLLRDFAAGSPAPHQPGLHVSSFVIVSPEARLELDRKNLVGLGWWGDDWWAEAQSSGLMSIECHSWDHVHYTLEKVAQADNLKGDFRAVKTPRDCEAQVNQAADYMAKVSGYRPRYYAYPWGHASRYLVEEFMPGRAAEHRFQAAFSIDPRHVSQDDDIWFLPRYVCGRDWKSPAQLETLLAGSWNGPSA